jgi:MFS family permease
MTASSPINPALTDKLLNATVIVTGLGLLVDFYDFIIFNMVRVPSLSSMGLAGDALTVAGLNIIGWQAAGLIVGAYLWGVLGDRLGRKACVLGSILTYSLATLGCAFVQTVDQYAALRFFAGMGIAGELGVGITMISERMSPRRRGYGVLIFLSLGFVGALLAALAAQNLDWRTCYLVGGIAGLLLLLMRALLLETSMFQALEGKQGVRGSLRFILLHPALARKYIANIVLLIPVVFVVQIVWTLSPEFARAFGVVEPVQASTVLAIGYGCVIFGDILAVCCSEYFKRRKAIILLFQIVSVLIVALYFALAPSSLMAFYIFNGAIGLSFGIWMLGTTVASEQFGTNIRATVSTTVPNFARGTALLFSPALLFLKDDYGLVGATVMLGAALVILSFIALVFLDETYGKDLDYIER